MTEKREPEKPCIEVNEAGEKTLKLDIFLRTLIQRCMGKALDYARISGMADRSLTQFERSVKDDFYTIVDDGIRILKETGYLNDGDK